MDFINFANTTLPTTTVAPIAPVPPLWGFIGLVIAVLFFGSNYLPVKQYETGDGMFFQLIICVAIWSVGLVVWWVRGFPQFYALPMLGGALWTTGNVNTVPIIKCIGLGLGMLFWGTVSLVVGWANARFGWFGIKKEIPSHEAMNYIGVTLASLSAIFYLFVKSDTHVNTRAETVETQPLINETNETTQQPADIHSLNRPIQAPDIGFFERLNPGVKRILGTGLAIFSGVLYGVTFTPELYAIDNYEGASQNGLDYAFSIYTGILGTSIIYFALYCMLKKNKPDVYPKAILPGLISGWMWGIANCSFILASTALSQSISYPIVASGPPVIASLYGIFLYKEIQGKRNFLILTVGFTFAIAGAVLCGLSK